MKKSFINLAELSDTISFEEFKKFKSIEDFKNRTRFGHNKKIYDYYKNYYNEFNPPYMFYSPIYQGISKAYKSFYYIIIEKGDDKILITYKYTHIFQTTFIRINDIPMSLNNNLDNVTEVLNILKKINCVRFVYKECYDNFFSDINENREPCLDMTDFYFDVNTQLKKHTNKYLTKIKVPRFIKDTRFRIKITNNLDEKDKMALETLRLRWYTDMPNADKDTEFANFIKTRDKNLYHCMIYYEDTMLSCHTFERFEKCIMLFFVTHLGRYKSQLTDDYLRASIAELPATAIYFLVDWCNKEGISRIYYEGATPSNPNLLKYKERVTDGSIKYLMIKEGNRL